MRLRLPFRPADDGWRDCARVVRGLPAVRPPGGGVRAAERRDLGPDEAAARCRRWSPPAPGRARPRRSSTRSSTTCCGRRRAGVTGMKALILYPMNALANDQAQRLAELHHRRTRRSAGVTAALYTGQNGPTRTHGDRRRADHRPGGRSATSAPDILLTNYKMLDQLLLRARRPGALAAESRDSLQYLVLDEFHTYDGAQGTDVAMLLRRLGLALKSHWPTTIRVTTRTGAPARPDHAGRDVGDARRQGRPRRDARLRAAPCSASRSTTTPWSPRRGSASTSGRRTPRRGRRARARRRRAGRRDVVAAVERRGRRPRATPTATRSPATRARRCSTATTRSPSSGRDRRRPAARR